MGSSFISVRRSLLSRSGSGGNHHGKVDFEGASLEVGLHHGDGGMGAVACDHIVAGGLAAYMSRAVSPESVK